MTAPTLTISSNSAHITFGSTTDTGLARVSAGIVKATDGSTGFGRFQANNGSNTSPGYGFSGDDAGMLWDAGYGLGFAVSNASVFIANSSVIRMVNSTQLAWSSGDPSSVGADAGLARAASYAVRVTDGSTGVGQLAYGVYFYANTGTFGPSNTHSGLMITNAGDGDGSAVNLTNDPTQGVHFTVTAVAAQNITITAAAGETLYFGNTACGTSLVVGGAATGIGDSVTVVAATGGSGAVWITTASAGTPVCTP